MGDYATLNKPRYFQHPLLKVILQFKLFSQNMTYMLARSVMEAAHKEYSDNERHDIAQQINGDLINDGRNPLTGKDITNAVDQYIKDVRKEAINRLGGTLGMTAIFAGATGMPLWSVVAGTMNMLNAAFGDDEDETYDFDNWFKNWCNNTFGGFVGDSISRGAVSQVLGADIASRLSLNDMWYRDARKSPDEITQFQNVLVQLLGPTASLGVSMADAYGKFKDGHIERSLEAATPAVIKNAMKSVRLANEGATTLRGNQLVGDITATEVFGQALGFSPERVAQRQKANIEMKTAEQAILTRRQALLDAHFMSYDTADSDMRQRVIEKVHKFNAAYPQKGITLDNLQDSVKTRMKQRALANMTGGMSIDKKLIGRLQNMGDYGNVDD
jgi:isochorismate hydrolase